MAWHVDTGPVLLRDLLARFWGFPRRSDHVELPGSVEKKRCRWDVIRTRWKGVSAENRRIHEIRSLRVDLKWHLFGLQNAHICFNGVRNKFELLVFSRLFSANPL
jgi:hypothetical protein